MSSGTADASPAINFNGGVGTSNMTNSINQGTKDYSEGFKTTIEYFKFLQIVESSSDFPLKYTQPFLNTTDPQVLDFIGKSRFLAKKVKEAIDQNINPWQSDAIKELLMILKHVPFDLQNLIDNELGYALKSIKKTSIAKNDADVQRESTALMAVWKELQNNPPNINGKRDNPERATAASSTTPQNEPKKIKLAIQKDPPAKPKAIIDNNFLSALGEPKTKPLIESKKFKIVRPIYNVDTLITANNTPSANNSPTTTLSPMKRSSPSSPQSPFNRSVVQSNRRRVTFKDDICQIRIYEPDPEEWTSFDNHAPEDIENFYPLRQTQQQQQQPPVHYNYPQIDWYSPLELSFNTDENPNLVIPKLIRTPESFQQDNREKVALAAIYTSIQHIPVSPGEPEEDADPNINTSMIPLEDINNVSYNSTPTPPSSTSTTGSINPNELFSAATLNAIAAAIKDPSLLQQHQPVQQQLQQQPIYHQQQHQIPVMPIQQQQQHQIPVMPTQQQQQQPQMNNQYNYQPSQQRQQQPDLSNVAVEAVLKNNPGIIQSLKQLSFLASGNTMNNVTNTMVPPQPMYQQPLPQPNNYTHDESYGNEPNHRRPRKTTRSRTRAQRKGGRSRVCAFYNTPEGCKKGDTCPWPHE